MSSFSPKFKRSRAVRAAISEVLETRLVMSISPIASATGLVSMTVDGLGTSQSSGTISTVKPAGATVRSAYLFSASLPGGAVSNGDITVDGTGINFPNTVNSSINSKSYYADVTTLVKPKIDAAPAGNIDFTIGEKVTTQVDGEILAVIYDDPTQTTSNTVILLFGAQTATGDTFNIGLANPIDTNVNTKLDLSLGISFSYQYNGIQQYSTIDVNGTRLTSAAGGQDDASGDTGTNALLTAGGIGDSDANPADPNATPSKALAERSDDELYNLASFVKNGDTQIKVDTKNPSNDDNIFFAAMSLQGATAVVGEGVTLAPSSSTVDAGTSVDLTATVQDNNGKAVANRDVTFTVKSGPDTGASQVVKTDSTGKAIFTLTGNTAGTDVVSASFLDSTNKTNTSNDASVTFNPVTTPDQPPVVNAGPDVVTNQGVGVTLHGSATDVDSVLTNSSYSWIVLSGANVQVASGTGPDITFTPPAVGTYTAKLTVDDGEGGSASDTAVITSQPVVKPVTQAVTSYVLVNADTDKDIRTIKNGDTINLATLPTHHLNIRAVTSPSPVGSVKLKYDAKTIIENTVPYAVLGDIGGNYFNGVLTLGHHTLSGTPFTLVNMGGTAGTALTIGFNVVNLVKPAIQSLVLYNTDTDKPIKPLTNGAVIDLSDIGTKHLTVRALTIPHVIGSVKFILDNVHTSIENVEPYSLFENMSSNYFAGLLTIGQHTLIVEPFSAKNAGGTAGTPLTIHFKVQA